MNPPIVHVFDDASRLAHGAADAIVFDAVQAVAQRGHFHWALAGGGTPKATYGVIAAPPHRDSFPWDRFNGWLGDERAVPSTDPASNHRMALESLLRPAGAEPGTLFAFDTTGGDLDRAADDYETLLLDRVPRDEDGAPVLDLVMLGLGSDTHTASWFPGSTFPDDRYVAAVHQEHLGHRRLTLTPATINAARRVLFLVSGEGKREALERVFDEDRNPQEIPAQRVEPKSGHVMWMIDRDAAGQFFAS